MISEKKMVRDLVNNTCIKRVPVNSRELPAMGGKGYYTWQFYLRSALLNPVCLKLIGTDFWDKNENLFRNNSFQLAGLESAAMPLITTIILEAHQRGISINAFTVRKTRKEYGLRNIIEGIPTSEPIFFIDDITSPQHNSFWQVLNTLTLQNLSLNGHGYVLVLKKQQDETNIIETSLGVVAMQSLFTLSDFDMTLEEYILNSKEL